MLTVLIASRNGEAVLPRTLAALCAQTLPFDQWKVVVADNGSTDGTAEVMESFARRLPLSSVYEASPGKNRALNKALALAEGDLLVFSDDDVVTPKQWLSAFRLTADRNTDFSIFGGPIAPLWPKEPGEWILQSIPVGAAFGVTPDPVGEGESPVGHIWGTNMMVRSAALATYGALPENVGPSSGSYAMGSESAFLCALAREGHRSYFINE